MEQERVDIYYKLGEIHGDIKSVLIEAKRTNGRVTTLESVTVPRLERDINEIKSNIAKYTGIVAVIVFLAGIILPKLLDKFL